MFGMSMFRCVPISCTAPTRASSSSARPASASCSIEVLKPPSWRASARRSSPDWPIGQPICAPINAASCIVRSTKACTSGSSSRRSVAAPVRALTGFIVMLPHSLYQMAWRMSALGSAMKPACASALHTVVVRIESPPAGSPTISRSPNPCRTRPGSGLAQVRWTTQPSTRCSGSNAAMPPSGSTATMLRPASAADGGAACRNHHGTPFIAGSTIVCAPMSGCIACAAAASDGPFSATTTRSCGPRSRASSLAVTRGHVCAPFITRRSPCARTAARVAPRASAHTSCPALANRAAISPPTAPKPTTAIFIDDFRAVGLAVAGVGAMVAMPMRSSGGAVETAFARRGRATQSPKDSRRGSLENYRQFPICIAPQAFKLLQNSTIVRFYAQPRQARAPLRSDRHLLRSERRCRCRCRRRCPRPRP